MKRACILLPLLVLISNSRSDSAAVGSVESFWQSIGMRVTRLSPDEHDRLLADVSHLPHVIAAAIVMLQTEASTALAGKGFLDTTRIAAGDPGLWRDIVLDNADNLRDSLRRLRIYLERFEAMLDPSQRGELRHWLDSAAQKRRLRNDAGTAGE